MFSHHLITILMLLSLGLARPILRMLWAAWHSHRGWQNVNEEFCSIKQTFPSLRKCDQLKNIESKLPPRVSNGACSLEPPSGQMETKVATLHMNMHEQPWTAELQGDMSQFFANDPKWENCTFCQMSRGCYDDVNDFSRKWGEFCVTPRLPTLCVAKTMGNKKTYRIL